jgi:integrase
MSPRLVKYLKQWQRLQGGGHYMFTWVHKRIQTHAIWAIVRSLGVKCGFPWPIHSHMLKHSCGHYMGRATNGNVLKIMEWLGHKNVKNTMMYLRDVKNPITSYF